MTGERTVRGQRFRLPRHGSAETLVAEGERLALATIVGTGTDVRGNDTLTYDLAGIDLEWVRRGWAPLLVEHRVTLDYQIGGIVEAWIEGGELRALVRFAESGEGERIWRMLAGGFALGLSLGASVVDAEPIGKAALGGTAWRVTRWQLTEVSVVALGQIDEAHLQVVDQATIGERLANLRTAADAARIEVRRRLHLDAWAGWSDEAATRLAAELGLDAGRLQTALGREVLEQITRLEEDLAVPVLGERAAA